MVCGVEEEVGGIPSLAREFHENEKNVSASFQLVSEEERANVHSTK